MGMKMLGEGLKFCVCLFLCKDNYFLKGKSKLFNSFTEPCFFNTFDFYSRFVCCALSVRCM